MAKSRSKNTHLETRAETALIGVKFHQGPLPSPQDFAAYEMAQPGAADRLLTMAEVDQRARIKDQRTERYLTFVLSLLSHLFMYGLVVAAVYLATQDKPLEAFFAGLAPIAIAIYANTRKPTSSNE